MDDAQMLKTAADVPDDAINCMAHALGWPDLLAQKHKRVRWRNPYRNGYSYAFEPPWLDQLVSLGLVVEMPFGAYRGFSVTGTGRAVTMLRLRAAWESRRNEKDNEH